MRDFFEHYGLVIIEAVGMIVIMGVLINVCLPAIGDFIKLLLERIM